MLKKSKTIVVNGSSAIQNGGTENEVATMNANIDENGGISQNSYINSRTEYLSHKAEVDADMAEFNKYINSLMEV